MTSTLLYAPNVHTGGGLVLLQAVLASWPVAASRRACLDERARHRLLVPAGTEVTWVRPTVASRLAGERALRAAAQNGDTVLCFHGLPPLLSTPARVVVYQQNRNYLGLNRLGDFAPRTALRLAFERFVSWRFRHRVHEYIVQTPTMAAALTHWYGPGCPPVRLLPFVDRWPAPGAAPAIDWDFVYVADGVAHKNHACLMAAWQLLAEQGFTPSLALTLGPRDTALAQEIDALSRRAGLRVVNLGEIDRSAVLALYARSRALVFPSTSESFGLPLIEATSLGLPIVAAELDYVRDVCVPAQTFDPLSPVSLARAVRRFLNQPDPTVVILQAPALWAALAHPATPAA